jgi:hypothetical protein
MSDYIAREDVVRCLRSELDEDGYYVLLRLPSLQLDILNFDGTVLRKLIGDEETLDCLLDDAVDGAYADGDWSGLVLLRQCLLKWADESQSALQQMGKDKVHSKAQHHEDGTA